MATLYLKKSREPIAHGELGRDFIFLGSYVYIDQKCFHHQLKKTVNDETKIPFLFSTIYGTGPLLDLFELELPVKKKLGIIVERPGLAFLAGKGKVLINTKNDYYFEHFDEKLPFEKIPIKFAETELIYKSETLNSLPQKVRILSIINNEFKVIDQRSGALFLKHKKDERTWQLLFDKTTLKEDSPFLILTLINHNQWAFEYLESKEARKNNESPMTPEDYFDSLDLDFQKRICTSPDCKQIRAKGSELCKIHHYELVMGIPFPVIKK